MSLILKIAAGIIIGMLCVQIITTKWMNYNYEKTSEEFHIAAELRTKTVLFMNVVRRHYREHEELPRLLADLDCSLYADCATGEEGSNFYINYRDDWIVVEPYLIGTTVKYNCETTLKDLFDPDFYLCANIDNFDIPSSVRSKILLER